MFFLKMNFNASLNPKWHFPVSYNLTKIDKWCILFLKLSLTDSAPQNKTYFQITVSWKMRRPGRGLAICPHMLTAEAKKMKLLTLHTHVCPRASLRVFSSSLSCFIFPHSNFVVCFISRAHSFLRQNLTNSAANLVNSAAHRDKADEIPRIHS